MKCLRGWRQWIPVRVASLNCATSEASRLMKPLRFFTFPPKPYCGNGIWPRPGFMGPLRITMQMTPENWKQVKALFESVLDQPPAQRPEFLREKCPDDAIRREVEKLLENYAEAGNFLSVPAMNPRVAIPREVPDTRPIGDSSSGAPSGAATSAAVRLGEALGNYRIVSRLGEGGMGQVWLAEQTGPLQRQVALKLIRVGLYDDS